MQSPHRTLGPTRRSLLLGAGATALTTAAAGTLPSRPPQPPAPPRPLPSPRRTSFP